MMSIVEVGGIEICPAEVEEIGLGGDKELTVLTDMSYQMKGLLPLELKMLKISAMHGGAFERVRRSTEVSAKLAVRGLKLGRVEAERVLRSIRNEPLHIYLKLKDKPTVRFYHSDHDLNQLLETLVTLLGKEKLRVRR